MSRHISLFKQNVNLGKILRCVILIFFIFKNIKTTKKVSRVDNESPAAITGVKSGDCVLEVNGEDILGMRITEVASLVRSKNDHVALLLWTTGMDPKCHPDSLCCGPMPMNLERLTASITSILAALECPVCMDTIPPPCVQCQNGHLVCAKCSMRAEKCPVCRDKYSPGRSLIAENVYNSITEAFQLNLNDGKLREKLFGAKCKRVRKMVPTEIDKPMKSHTHTFLAKLLGKSTSVDNIMSKKEDEKIRLTYQSTNMDKRKSISLSTSEIFCPDTTISIRRCPSGSTLGCHTDEDLVRGSYQPTLNGGNFLGTKRPKSCNVSAERINNFQDIQIHVPAKISETEFLCPADISCDASIKASALISHILTTHKIPIISFGTSSAEISLPPRSPVENACLVLALEQHQFWLRLDYNGDGDIFVSVLIQGDVEEARKYVLEIAISNSEKADIFRKELITRHQVYDMEQHSWKVNFCKDVVGFKKGLNIKFSCNFRM